MIQLKTEMKILGNRDTDVFANPQYSYCKNKKVIRIKESIKMLIK
jgi:hypothetical protein